MTPSNERTGVLIVGAGPYGLSLASYLSFLGMDYRVVGEPMHFWKTHMVGNNLLRSTFEHTYPASPGGNEHFSQWTSANVLEIDRRPIETLFPTEFREYMRDFIRHYDIQIDSTRVDRVTAVEEGFVSLLDGGRVMESDSVVVATGLAGTENYPEWFQDLPGEARAIHACRVHEYDDWQDRKVLIVGAGQSAAEAVGYIAARGAKSVDLAFRGKGILYNSMHVAFSRDRQQRLFRLKHAFPYSSLAFRQENYRSALPISVEPHMREVVEASAVLLPQHEVQSARYDVVHDRIGVKFNNGESRDYSAVICGTGYRPSIDALSFTLETRDRREIRSVNGLPDIDESGESSQRGLFFAGQLAALRFGPQANFIFGSHQMVPRIVGRLAHFRPAISS